MDADLYHVDELDPKACEDWFGTFIPIVEEDVDDLRAHPGLPRVRRR